MNAFPSKYLLACLLASLAACQNNSGSRDWPAYGGNKAGNRYSSLQQINKDNVSQLQLAWTYDTGDNNDSTGSRGIDIQCQPIVVHGVLYAVTPRMKLFALDAATGKQIWLFDPFADSTRRRTIHAVRGVVYWEDGDDKRILYSVGTNIYAVNAATGKKIESFGNNGEVDMRIGLRDNPAFDSSKYSMRSTSPGAVYKDILIMGSSVSEGPDAPPGYIQGFNVRTGKLVWVFHTIPLPGEYGYETWSPDSYKKLGAANCWSGITVDEKRGIAFLSTGSPSVDFYGGARKGQNLFANCILALDALTGKRIWHYQTVHHDLWDRDLPCPPNLITVKHNGRNVDAVAQPTKDGLLFVLDRETGKPLFPVNEVEVPTSPALPGESPWPTQPVPVKPAPFSMQEVTEDNLTNRTITARAYALGRYNNSAHGSKYLPPNEKGTLFLGFGGGAEWGGTATDSNGILFINSNNMLWWHKMSDASSPAEMANATPGQQLFNINCVSCHGANGGRGARGEGAQAYPDLTDVGKRLTRQQISATIEAGRGRMPSFQQLPKNERDLIVDYLLHTEKKSTEKIKEHFRDYNYSPPYVHNGMVQFRDNDGYPAVKPPWGVLNAIDLNTGDYLWQVPLGEYPELSKQGLAPTGTENHGGPLVTAGGLLFIAATYDGHLRAFDTKTGKVVWQYKLPAGAFATPITYMVNGKQFIAIACGGTRYGLPSGGSYIALALPN
jgi:quinoprotein glucose dehydrogenase